MSFQIHRGFNVGLSHKPRWAPERPLAVFLHQEVARFCHAAQSEPVTSENTALRISREPRLTVALSLIFSAVPAPSKLPEGFLGWLAIFAGNLWLMILLRGRSSRLAWVVKKVVMVGLSVCLLYGFWMLMNWRPLWELLAPFGLTQREAGFWLMLGAILIWGVSFGLFSQGVRDSRESSRTIRRIRLFTEGFLGRI